MFPLFSIILKINTRKNGNIFVGPLSMKCSVLKKNVRFLSSTRRKVKFSLWDVMCGWFRGKVSSAKSSNPHFFETNKIHCHTQIRIYKLEVLTWI